MRALIRTGVYLFLGSRCCGADAGPRHYVFFNRDRQGISDATFLEEDPVYHGGAYRAAQMKHCYPLLRQAAGHLPTGIAVQEGNYGQKDLKTGARLTIAELVEFAKVELEVDYIFWCTEEPYYSRDLVTFLGGNR